MEMSDPAPCNPLDDNRQGLIGKSIERVDGMLKVTGKAAYAYEVRERHPAAYGFIVEATIATGVVSDIDTRSAERAPGVLLVMTHKNAPAQGAWGPLDMKDRYARAAPQLGGDRIVHYGQAVAFVVARSFEQARCAARMVKVSYEPAQGEYVLADNLARAEQPADQFDEKIDSIIGDFDTAYAAAPVTVDSTFTTPCHIQAQMEPRATLAYWNDGHLTIHCSAQLLNSVRPKTAAY